MKKLTKKSLDELAEKMPVVSESEQQCLIGGTFYFDYEGNFIGKIDDGRNELRVATSIIAIDSSVGFSQASQNTVGAVLSTMAHTMGISGNIDMGYLPGNIAQTNSNGQITFNIASSLFNASNYYDFLSVLYHEHHHQMTMGDHGSGQSEYQALIYEINQSSFQYTSEAYRQDTMSLYYNYHSGQSYY